MNETITPQFFLGLHTDGNNYFWMDVTDEIGSAVNEWFASVALTTDFWIDDLHFAGRIARETYNSTNISSNDEVQVVIIDDTAHDDSMKATDDSSTCARLTYAELLRRQTIPLVGTLTIPGAEDSLPSRKFTFTLTKNRMEHSA